MHQPILFVLISISLFSACSTDTRIVEISEVYDQFHLTQELQLDLEQKFSDQFRFIDSLNIVYGNQQPIDSIKINELFQLRERIQNVYYEKNKKNNDIIWKRINTYFQEYGKKRNYEIIMGAKGDGNIMFAKEELNITKDFIEFINNRYHDK